MQASQLCGTLIVGWKSGWASPMLRTCSRFVALATVVAGPSMTAQAADTTLTLACQGTVTIKSSGPAEYEPDPISMGLIVNFTNRTVQGASRRGPYLFDDQLQIIDANENTVVFRGFSKFLGMTIDGHMDRVTGDVGMLATAELGWPYVYALKCRPAQRMF
jgi:hypothetical protein